MTRLQNGRRLPPAGDSGQQRNHNRTIYQHTLNTGDVGCRILLCQLRIVDKICASLIHLLVVGSVAGVG